MNTFQKTTGQIAKKTWGVFVVAVSIIFSLLISIAGTAQATQRPFPQYDLSFEWIHGKADPQWKPGDPGDGCLCEANPQVTHLSTFGFRTVINPCDGVRTTMRWYYTGDQTVGENTAPTNQFRLGVTWQYTRRDSNDPYFWKPVENMLLDGKPIDTALYDPADQESVVVKKADGTWSHIPDRPTGFFEPKHVVFDDVFEFDEEHTFVWDAYLPVFGDYGGMTIGTGSTGDTEGGSIGAKANGLYVSIPAYADFRYVLDSEYRQALGITDTESDGQPIKLPHRPLARWSGELAGSTYTTIACLEDSSQFLSPVLASQKTTEIYPELAKKYPNIAASTDEVQVADGSGSYGLGRWPYEFSLRQPGTWASASGLRPMNYDSAAGQFLDYGDKNLPYKPTFESVKKEIPGYTYVDNDLPVEEKGVFDSMGSGGIPLFKPAPNIKLSYHKQVGYETQHLYFTYKKNPGTFRVEKTNPDGAPIAGAKFALYKVVDNTPSACGVVTEAPTDVEDIKVCDATDPQACEELTVQQVVLDDFETSDGTFVTGVDGTYMPAGEPSLEPGRYVVKELSVPEPYLISRQYTVFEIPIQAGKNDAGDLVSMTVPGVAKVVNHPDYVNVPVTKVWDDGDDVDGLRPLTISVELLADGMPTGKQVELNADNNWSAQFTDLPRTKDGRAVVYSVAEEVVEGYQVTVSGDAQTGFVLTNSHKPVVPPTPPVVPPHPPTELPKTGLNIAVAAWVALFISGLGLGFVGRNRKTARGI